MSHSARSTFQVSPRYQPLMREIGLDGDAIFDHADIKVWRSIPERENCTLDAQSPDGKPVRLHIKRYRNPSDGPADVEGIQLLESHGIPTTPLVGWGVSAEGRSFVMTEDLAGFTAADRLIQSGLPFDKLLKPTADLAAKLHEAGLHQRDLYLCHFFAKIDGESIELRLIDAARVRRLPGFPFRQRWIVKDLAQFWYSVLQLNVDEPQRRQWFDHYAAARRLCYAPRLLWSVQRKAAWIARHDARLNARQPMRNISIPQPPP